MRGMIKWILPIFLMGCAHEQEAGAWACLVCGGIYGASSSGSNNPVDISGMLEHRKFGQQYEQDSDIRESP